MEGRILQDWVTLRSHLERATELARLMVCRFGMSELGAQSFGRPPSRFVPAELETRSVSERTAERIDEEVARLLDSERRRARRLLGERRFALDAVAARLLVRETLEGGELLDLARARARRARPRFTDRSCGPSSRENTRSARRDRPP